MGVAIKSDRRNYLLELYLHSRPSESQRHLRLNLIGEPTNPDEAEMLRGAIPESAPILCHEGPYVNRTAPFLLYPYRGKTPGTTNLYTIQILSKKFSRTRKIFQIVLD